MSICCLINIYFIRSPTLNIELNIMVCFLSNLCVLRNPIQIFYVEFYIIANRYLHTITIEDYLTLFSYFFYAIVAAVQERKVQHNKSTKIGLNTHFSDFRNSSHNRLNRFCTLFIPRNFMAFLRITATAFGKREEFEITKLLKAIKHVYQRFQKFLPLEG